MICPNCNQPLDKHGSMEGMGYFDSAADVFYPCHLTELQATLAAQRHSAAVGLWAMRDNLRGASLVDVALYGLRMPIYGYQQALRDCGIQRQRRSDAP